MTSDIEAKTTEVRYANGQLQHRVTYKNKKPHGVWEYYEISGAVKWKGICKDGRERGLWHEDKYVS